MKSYVKVFAPATVSNVGCGFDVLGFAVDRPGDEVVLTVKEEPGVTISAITGDEGKLPHEPERNTAGVAVLKMLAGLKLPYGIDIAIHKKMPLGSGLGSSSASAVAAAFALNELLETKLSRDEIFTYALEGEMIASGSIPHGDNVAPCLYGGFTIIRTMDPPDIINVETPDDLFCAVVHPHIEINTLESRKLLPKELPLKTALTQVGNIASFIAGLTIPDYELIRRSIHDAIAEPVRQATIPGFPVVKEAAMNAGALGCGISGSGPSIFALTQGEAAASLAADAMSKAFDEVGLSNDKIVSSINKQGPRVIESY